MTRTPPFDPQDLTRLMIERAPTKLRHKDPAIPRAELSMRNATSDDASMVANWLSNTDELLWVGGIPKVSKEDQLASWMKSPYGAYILCRGQESLAFINIDNLMDGDIRTRHMEVGRLVVNNKARRQGHGSTLLLYTTICLQKLLGINHATQTAVYMRVIKDNISAVSMFRLFPFSEHPDPRRNRDALHIWYSTGLPNKAFLLQRLVKERRQETNLSIQQVAFYAGVSPSMISSIESGTRRPAPETMHNLALVLSRTPAELVSMALAYLSETVPDNVLSSHKMLDHLDNENTNLWIISDEIAELIDDRFLSSSVSALESGFNRFYFVARGKDDEDVQRLVRAFETRLSPEASSQYLRIYKAPETLCRLRLVVRNPREFGADTVTVAGPGTTRISIPEERSSSLVMSLRKHIMSLENISSDHTDIDGFAKLYPSMIE